MLVATYWAECRLQQRLPPERPGRTRRRVTVRRLGWSNDSQAAAQAMAEARAQQALAQRLSGGQAAWCEPRVAYNGADGVPIREELLARQGEAVLTRNVYGARCLNTAEVLFADIDFPTGAPGRWWAVGALLGAGLGAALAWWGGPGWAGPWLEAWGLAPACRLPATAGWGPVLLGVALGALLGGWLARRLWGLGQALQGGVQAVAVRRLRRWAAQHPAWGLRVYATPAGLRVLATHATFDATSAEVAACFAAWGVDPLYARMCQRQRCFRARVSPKPWRMGLARMPRSGVWPPQDPARVPLRQAWVQAYEAAAPAWAACRALATLGPAAVHPAVQPVLDWHDALSQAHSAQPLA